MAPCGGRASLLPRQVPLFRLCNTNSGAYGREPRAETLPAGTYLVPMAQSQKHFVQAALNESTYPSVPVFYDVAAWSQPLLLNLDGGSSGAELRGNARRYGTLVGPLGDTPPLPAPSTVPRTAIWLDGRLNYIEQSVGWLQHTWEAHWGLPRDGYTVVSATDIRDGVLADHDALVLPEGAAGSGPRQLDRADTDDADTEDGRGTAEIRALVERGGTPGRVGAGRAAGSEHRDRDQRLRPARP